MLERQDGGRNHVRIYDHVGEVGDQAERILRTGDENECASISGDYAFTQTHSLDEALTLLRDGWQEGTQAAQDLLDTIDIPAIAEQFPKRFSQEIEYDVVGDTADVGRFLVNDPENMINVTPSIDRIGSIANVLVNLTQRAKVSADRMRRRGVVTLGLVEALTSLGYSVNVEGYSLATPTENDYSETWRVHIPLLKAGMPTNLDTISFAIANPSFCRRIIFALRESESRKIRDCFGFRNGEGYGCSQDLDTRLYEQADTIHIGKDEALCKSDRQMPKELERLLRGLFEREAELEYGA